MREEEYEEIQFSNSTSQNPANYQLDKQFDNQPLLLSKKQQDEMLYSIKIQENQNLLDLSCQMESPIVENYKYRDLMENRICKIGQPVTIHDGYIVTYKLYQVKTKKKDNHEYDSTVDRRFSDFQYLQCSLVQNFGGCVIPCIPQKNLWASFDLQTENDKKTRRKYLQKYLNKILQHPKFKHSQQLREFLFDSQRNFSAKKGEFTSQNKLEDKVWKLTYDIYDFGSSLKKQYWNNQQGPDPSHHTPKTKEENQILHYKLVVQNMGNLLESLKIVLQNAADEQKLVNSLSNTMNLLLKQNETITQEQIAQQLNFEECPSVHKKAFDQFEDLVDFVMSCRQSIDRCITLHAETDKLKIEQKYLLDNKNNPRNARLDIVRSQVNKNHKKIQQWTKDLLSQLQNNITYGQSLTNQFIEELTEMKLSIYKFL